LWRSYEAFRRIAEGTVQRNETNMTTTLNMRPSLGSRRFREFGRWLMTKTHSKQSRKRLFIEISGFEILAFAVRVRPVESLGSEKSQGWPPRNGRTNRTKWAVSQPRVPSWATVHRKVRTHDRLAPTAPGTRGKGCAR